MSKHTSGPWKVYRGGILVPGYDVAPRIVADKYNDQTGDAEGVIMAGGVGWPNDADARLIAAAPELLAFAENYVASQDYCIEGGKVDPKTCECTVCVLNREARAAIAKAKGAPTAPHECDSGYVFETVSLGEPLKKVPCPVCGKGAEK